LEFKNQKRITKVGEARPCPYGGGISLEFKRERDSANSSYSL